MEPSQISVHNDHFVQIVDLPSFESSLAFIKEKLPNLNAEKFFIVTDKHLADLYGLVKSDHIYVLEEPGEHNKCMETANAILEHMIRVGHNRSSTVIGFGKQNPC